MSDSGSNLQILLEKIKIKDVMKTSVVCMYEDDELSAVSEAFVKNKVYYLPVISREKQLVGLISSKYLYKTQSPRKMVDHYDVEMQYNPDLIVDGDSIYSKETLDSFILRNVMQRNPLTLLETNSLRDAIHRLNASNAGCITIIDAHRYVRGILTSQEIIYCLANL